MKIEISTAEDGTTETTLSEVYSGVGIKTEMGLFGIAQRDGGIEVMLNGKTVWTSHEIVNEHFELGRPSTQGRLNDSDLVSSDGPGYSPYRTDCPVCAAPVGENCKNGLESLSSVHMGRVRAVNRSTP